MCFSVAQFNLEREAPRDLPGWPAKSFGLNAAVRSAKPGFDRRSGQPVFAYTGTRDPSKPIPREARRVIYYEKNVLPQGD